MKITLIGFFVIVFWLTSLGAEVYRWKDDKGKWHFTDKPQGIPQAEKMELQPLNGMTAVKIPKGLFYRPDKSRAKRASGSIRAGGVVMYSTPTCGFCLRAKDYFRKNNVSFSEKDVSTPGPALEEFAALGGGGVPLILVGTRDGTKKVRGFSPDTLDSLLGINRS